VAAAVLEAALGMPAHEPPIELAPGVRYGSPHRVSGAPFSQAEAQLSPLETALRAAEAGDDVIGSGPFSDGERVAIRMMLREWANRP
jgi:hypothetical protein